MSVARWLEPPASGPAGVRLPRAAGSERSIHDRRRSFLIALGDAGHVPRLLKADRDREAAWSATTVHRTPATAATAPTTATG